MSEEQARFLRYESNARELLRLATSLLDAFETMPATAGHSELTRVELEQVVESAREAMVRARGALDDHRALHGYGES